MVALLDSAVTVPTPAVAATRHISSRAPANSSVSAFSSSTSPPKANDNPRLIDLTKPRFCLLASRNRFGVETKLFSIGAISGSGAASLISTTWSVAALRCARTDRIQSRVAATPR